MSVHAAHQCDYCLAVTIEDPEGWHQTEEDKHCCDRCLKDRTKVTTPFLAWLELRILRGTAKARTQSNWADVTSYLQETDRDLAGLFDDFDRKQEP